MLRSVGWVPPYRCPSRRLLRSRGEGRGLITRSKIAPIPGPRRRRWLEMVITGSGVRLSRCGCPSGGEWHEARDGPGEGGHLPGNGYHDLVDVLPAGGQLPIPSAQADLRLPANRLNLGREFLQAELQMATNLGGIPVGPRPFYQRASGVAVAGLGDAALAAPLTRRVLRGGQPEVAHQLPRVLEARDIPQLGHQDDGAGELHAPQRLDRLDDRVQPPALHRLVQLALHALHPLLLLGDR